jgi:hypothetical protein
VQAFIDLQGTSGVHYRFRLSPNGQADSPIAGNYALVRPEDSAVVAIGSTNDLRLATAEWTRARIEHSGVQLYTRLNVSASARETEQADLASHYKLKSKRLPI